MQLDDVVGSTVVDAARFEEATHRTTRWLDRCVAAHGRPTEQNLFAIIQGGLDSRLRDISLKACRLHSQHRSSNGSYCWTPASVQLAADWQFAALQSGVRSYPP